MSKSKKTYKPEEALTKNNGKEVRFLKRKQEELEHRMLLEDSLKEMTEENQKLGLYEDPH